MSDSAGYAVPPCLESVADRKIKRLRADLARVTEERDTYYQKYADTCSTLASRDKEHCKDCCCARSWKALGIAEYTGKSIPEHIEELKSERDHWKRYALKGCE